MISCPSFQVKWPIYATRKWFSQNPYEKRHFPHMVYKFPFFSFSNHVTREQNNSFSYSHVSTYRFCHEVLMDAHLEAESTVRPSFPWTASRVFQPLRISKFVTLRILLQISTKRVQEISNIDYHTPERLLFCVNKQMTDLATDYLLWTVPASKGQINRAE